MILLLSQPSLARPCLRQFIGEDEADGRVRSELEEGRGEAAVEREWYGGRE